MRSQRLWNAFQTWIEYRPEGMDDHTARVFVMARPGFPCAAAAHFGLCIVFYLLGLNVLFVFNIGSTILWSYMVWRVNWHGEIKMPFVLGAVVEIPVHGVLATYYLGVETGFFLYILLTIITSVLTPFMARPVRLGMSVFFVLVLTATCTFSVLFGAVTPLPREANAAFFAFNSLLLTLLIAVVMALYDWIAERAEQNLIESRRRTQVVNESLENVSRQLAKYISPQLYRAILNGEQEVRVESRRKKLSVFFSDIVGFTETTDQLQSEELTSLLNEYLTEMSKIANRHGANFDKFIGDAIVLYFGDPETRGTREDAAACVRMALEMQRKMELLQSTWRDRGLERPFQIRIGINTGFCTVGNFGSEDRMDYTIIGGEVNLAARLEAMAEPGGILLANETYQLVKDWVIAEEADTIHVKGISRPVATYRVSGSHDEPSQNGQRLHLNEPGISLTIDQTRMDAGTKKDAVTKLRAVIDAIENGC